MTKNPMISGDHFRLGTFSTNCSSGMTPTKIAERWDNSWDNNLTLAKMLDDAGIDFTLQDVCDIFRDTPYFVNLRPGGAYVAKDLFEIQSSLVVSRAR